jgi:TusA-related sulfurtransferase
MAAPTAVTVDVRDMTCAQALAVIAQSMARLTAGQGLDVLHSAEDVKQDVWRWAADRGHRASEPSAWTVHLQRGMG